MKDDYVDALRQSSANVTTSSTATRTEVNTRDISLHTQDDCGKKLRKKPHTKFLS